MFQIYVRRCTGIIIALASAGLLIMMLFVATPYLPAKARATSSASPNYAWQQLKIGGGGYVTGIAIHPTVSGLMYIRTDVGGA